MNKQKRISIAIPVRSIGLKRFVEKAVKDDEFFLFALENPLGAMKECGVKLDASFHPKDFAAFFGALSGVKEMIKKKNIKDLSFEGIFGQAADIRGTYLMAETTRGIYKNWDIDAYSQKQVLSTSDKYFEVDRNRLAIRNILQKLETELMTEIIGINTFADPSKQTESGSDKKWDNLDAIRKSESTNGWNKNFASDWADILGGPLIRPEDLAALAARIKTFTEIAEEVEQ